MRPAFLVIVIQIQNMNTAEEKPHPEPTNQEILLGGVHRNLRLRPTDESGEWQVIPKLIKLVPFRHMRMLASVWANEMLEIGVYLNLPDAEVKDFVERLHPDDHALVMEEVRRLNFRNFSAWFDRNQKATKVMESQSGESVKTAMAALLEHPEGRKMLESHFGKVEGSR